MASIIYVLLDPRDMQIRYVGRTIGYVAAHLQSRVSGHLSEARRGATAPKSAWVRELLGLSLHPVAAVLEFADEKHGATRENFWIDSLRGSGCNLLNKARAGRSPARRPRSAPKWSAERRASFKAGLLATKAATVAARAATNALLCSS